MLFLVRCGLKQRAPKISEAMELLRPLLDERDLQQRRRHGCNIAHRCGSVEPLLNFVAGNSEALPRSGTQTSTQRTARCSSGPVASDFCCPVRKVATAVFQFLQQGEESNAACIETQDGILQQSNTKKTGCETFILSQRERYGRPVTCCEAFLCTWDHFVYLDRSSVCF